jgi:hypothetical protein
MTAVRFGNRSAVREMKLSGDSGTKLASFRGMDS